MKRKIGRSTAVMGLTSLACACAALAIQYWPISESIQWLDIDTALERARETQGRVYVDVSADWCVPCRKMDSEVFHDDSVLAALSASVIPARVDLDSRTGARVKREFSIQGVPTSIVLNARGQEVKRRVGAMSAEQFLQWLRSAREYVFSSWQPYNYARRTAQESHRRLMVLVIRDKSQLEQLENAFGRESLRAFIGQAFVPTLLVESVDADKKIIDGFGSSVVADHTAGTMLVFDEESRELARVPLTMQMLFSEMELVRALDPYAVSPPQGTIVP